MSTIRAVFFVAVMFFGHAVNAQDVPANSSVLARKGQGFFGWGYNRAEFSKSDIRVIGPGYDFTLYDVAAKDRAENFSFENYFGITRLAIPQFNIRWGYYIKDNVSVTFGYDHMKYVVRQWQPVPISGRIDSTASATYAGTYNQATDSIMIKHNFFDYEHTNGLNYMSFEIDFMYPLFTSKNQKFRVNLEGGGGAAAIIPRTDAFIFGFHGANIFHLAGFGVHGNGGFRFDLGKHFIFRACAKAGFIDLPDVLTFKDPGYKAKQHFWFLQEYGTLSYVFRVKKQK